MKITRDIVAKVLGSRKSLPINKNSFLGYKKIIETNDYSIYERPIKGNSIIAIEGYVAVKKISDRTIEIYPDLRINIKYRISLNNNKFPGIWEDSKILSCLLLPYMRVVGEDVYMQSTRLCIITDKGQIFHNYPARNKKFDGFSKNGDIINFEESVIWDLPDRKFPSENINCDHTEYYYPNLPKECYLYHPLPNDDINFKDLYENGGFPKKIQIKDENGKYQFLSRFYQYSRELQANSFRFMGSSEKNYKMNLLGTYCSNVDKGVRTCIFASDDGGRQWYCKYEFSDLGEYDFQQGHTGEWGKNWGNPIIISKKEYYVSNPEINVFKRNLLLPRNDDLSIQIKFDWENIGEIDKIYQRKDEAVVISFKNIHNLKNGMYSIKIKGLDRKFITNSWVEAMKIAWILGGGKND